MKVAHIDNKYNSVLTYLYCSKFLWLTDRILENRILTMLIRNIRLSCKRKKRKKLSEHTLVYLGSLKAARGVASPK